VRFGEDLFLALAAVFFDATLLSGWRTFCPFRAWERFFVMIHFDPRSRLAS
jgi:hypothetical protein